MQQSLRRAEDVVAHAAVYGAAGSSHVLADEGVTPNNCWEELAPHRQLLSAAQRDHARPPDRSDGASKDRSPVVLPRTSVSTDHAAEDVPSLGVRPRTCTGNNRSVR